MGPNSDERLFCFDLPMPMLGAFIACTDSHNWLAPYLLALIGIKSLYVLQFGTGSRPVCEDT